MDRPLSVGPSFALKTMRWNLALMSLKRSVSRPLKAFKLVGWFFECVDEKAVSKFITQEYYCFFADMALKTYFILF